LIGVRPARDELVVAGQLGADVHAPFAIGPQQRTARSASQCRVTVSLAHHRFEFLALFAGQKGEWPIVCLDDLASELDLAHQTAVVGQLTGVGAQVLVTGTELPAPLQGLSAHVFHVEQGKVAAPAIITA